MGNFNIKKYISEQRYKDVVSARSSLLESEGYVESMGPEFDQAIEQLQSVWTRWKEGPATQEWMIDDAREDIIQYLSSLLR